jgi:two-component system chemotaxis response regulator CheB
LWEIQDEEVLRFRCRVGHAYTAESMLAGKSEALEGAMWTALNTLEEGAQMSHRLAAESRTRWHASRSGHARRGSRQT